MSAPVRARIVRIGNSKGIRIPKLLLEQVGLGTEVEIQARGDELVVRAARRARAGWREQFELMAERGDDKLLDPDTTGVTEWDREEWHWSTVTSRFDIYLVAPDPTVGSELKKTRPCVIVSPDELNEGLATAVIAPVTTQGRQYPSRVPCQFQDKEGYVVLDQMRTVDKKRFVRRLGRLSSATQKAVLATIADFFAE